MYIPRYYSTPEEAQEKKGIYRGGAVIYDCGETNITYSDDKTKILTIKLDDELIDYQAIPSIKVSPLLKIFFGGAAHNEIHPKGIVHIIYIDNPEEPDKSDEILCITHWQGKTEYLRVNY